MLGSQQHPPPGSPCPCPQPSPTNSVCVPLTPYSFPRGKAILGTCTEDSGETATGMASGTSVPTASPVQRGLGAGGRGGVGGTLGGPEPAACRTKRSQQHLPLLLNTEGLGGWGQDAHMWVSCAPPPTEVSGQRRGRGCGQGCGQKLRPACAYGGWSSPGHPQSCTKEPKGEYLASVPSHPLISRQHFHRPNHPQTQRAGAQSRSVQTSPWGTARAAGIAYWEGQWADVHTAPIPLLPSPPTRAPPGSQSSELRPQPGPLEAQAPQPWRT